MQSFKNFLELKESTDAFSLEKIKAALSVFPLSTKLADRAEEAYKLAAAGIASGTIYNTDVEEIKAVISRQLENAYNKAQDEELYDKARSLPADERREYLNKHQHPTMFAVGSVKKLLAHHTQFAVQMPKSLKIIQGLEEYKNLMDKLKAITVKGRKPKEVVGNAPVPLHKRPADYNIQKQVVQYLQTAAAGVRQQLFASALDMTKKNIARLKAANITDRNSYWAFLKQNPSLEILAQKIFDVEKDRYNSNPVYQIVGDHILSDVAAKEASLITDEIIGQFVAKNTQKLSHIVQRKQGIKSHKILTNRVKNNVLENDMFFEFDDNSSFKIYSKVEYAYSPKGKLFMRMPTRFTDVTMPDGTKMKGTASEERMTTEF